MANAYYPHPRDVLTLHQELSLQNQNSGHSHLSCSLFHAKQLQIGLN